MVIRCTNQRGRVKCRLLYENVGDLNRLGCQLLEFPIEQEYVLSECSRACKLLTPLISTITYVPHEVKLLDKTL